MNIFEVVAVSLIPVLLLAFGWEVSRRVRTFRFIRKSTKGLPGWAPIALKAFDDAFVNVLSMPKLKPQIDHDALYAQPPLRFRIDPVTKRAARVDVGKAPYNHDYRYVALKGDACGVCIHLQTPITVEPCAGCGPEKLEGFELDVPASWPCRMVWRGEMTSAAGFTPWPERRPPQ